MQFFDLDAVFNLDPVLDLAALDDEAEAFPAPEGGTDGAAPAPTQVAAGRRRVWGEGED